MTRSIVEWPTESQRRGGVWILLALSAVLGILLLRNRQTISSPQPEMGRFADRLADWVDPNLASAAELAAVPGVGEKKAAAMVAYREAFVQSHHAGKAFDNAGDLQNVPGIGEATAENIEPYLALANDRPGTDGAIRKAKKRQR
jgi:competence ComEA-like helix-hairpin-helix protein